jgi:hypothetical protein
VNHEAASGVNHEGHEESPTKDTKKEGHEEEINWFFVFFVLVRK